MAKGAFTYHEAGTKCMSGKRSGMSGSGKMSSAHGTTGQSKDNNMNRTTGGDMLGSGCRTFKHGILGEPGGMKEGHVASRGVHRDKA